VSVVKLLAEVLHYQQHDYCQQLTPPIPDQGQGTPLLLKHAMI
jgi:hypothetical protein